MRDELAFGGRTDLAERIQGVITELLNEVPEPADGLMTTGEAAEVLGVRSLNTIKRGAADGLLDGFRRGGRIMVSRASVQRMLDQPTLHAQKEYEQDLAEALDPFDIGDEPLPPVEWPGRKPWEQERAGTVQRTA